MPVRTTYVTISIIGALSTQQLLAQGNDAMEHTALAIDAYSSSKTKCYYAQITGKSLEELAAHWEATSPYRWARTVQQSQGAAKRLNNVAELLGQGSSGSRFADGYGGMVDGESMRPGESLASARARIAAERLRTGKGGAQAPSPPTAPKVQCDTAAFAITVALQFALVYGTPVPELVVEAQRLANGGQPL